MSVIFGGQPPSNTERQPPLEFSRSRWKKKALKSMASRNNAVDVCIQRADVYVCTVRREGRSGRHLSKRLKLPDQSAGACIQLVHLGKKERKERKNKDKSKVWVCCCGGCGSDYTKKNKNKTKQAKHPLEKHEVSWEENTNNSTNDYI